MDATSSSSQMIMYLAISGAGDYSIVQECL